jgi:23S rRNA pseudouridine1911/1915/1917 synthase
MEDIEIIYQTKDYLVLNKPAGIAVHGDGRTKQYTLVDWLLENFPQVKGVGENLKSSAGKEIEKPGIVHRLDKETSGVILVALNQKTYEYFKKQFKSREVQKVRCK